MFTQFNFTKDKLQNLAVAPGRYSVLDKLTPHLRIMVYPSGIKTFMLCRKVNGEPRRIKIGRLSEITIEQARKEAMKLNGLIALGNDPLFEKKEYRNSANFLDLFNYYYEHHAILFTKRPLDNKRTMERTVFPLFGNMKACDMSADKIRMFHAKLAENTTKSNANRVIAIISAVFNFSIKNSYHKGDNPCTAVKKFRTKSRDRFLSQDELDKFFAAIQKEEELFYHFFMLLLYTGARKSNVLSMQWDDLDFQIKRWRIAETETKNGEVNVIPLSDGAVEILVKRKEANNKLDAPSRYVFPGSGNSGYLKDPKRAFDRVKIRMGIENFRMHDLRRTLGSYMAITGASLPIIGKALNHKSQISTAIYARLSQAPVLDAMEIAIKKMQTPVQEQ